MEQNQQKLYTISDIYSAFDMGLASAIYVLERSIILPVEERMHMLEGLRRRVRIKRDHADTITKIS